MTPDQWKRLRFMADGGLDYALSAEGCQAIVAACDEIEKLRRQVCQTIQEKPESFLADCCRFSKCTKYIDGQRVDYVPPHACVGQEPESPVEILKSLGDAVDDPEPEGGGSIRA